MKFKERRKLLPVIFSFFFLFFLSFFLYRNLSLNGAKISIDSRKSALANAEFFEEGFDTVAWLKIPGTNIDYPIIVSIDDALEYPVEKDKYGWIFTRDTKYDDVIHINGHNVFNLAANPRREADEFTRFEELLNFVYYDFAKDNRYIQYTVDGVDYLYEIYATGFYYPGDIYAFWITDDEKYDKEKVKKQIKFYQDYSLYHYDIDVSENDKLLTVMTCSRMYEKNGERRIFVVNARRVHEDEKIQDYNVTVNEDVYNEIKKLMKGDENNEETY